MTDLFFDDLNTLTNDQRYSAIADFAQAQPMEGNRHDFKRNWTSDTIKDVAALANTFGGLLIIGVEKNQSDHTAKLVGVTSNSELTTGMASAIASNISPTPSYDIMECHQPNEPTLRFCVIRIRSDGALYLVTKKGISPPVWVRNSDQTIAADAAQLRMLIDREKHDAQSTDEFLFSRGQRILDDMIIGTDYKGTLQNWTIGGWHRSETYFKLALIPRESKALRLDLRAEHAFVALIYEHYRRIQRCLQGVNTPANDVTNRNSDFYEYRWYHHQLDHESRWRITSHLDIAHATQINNGNSWSLLDVVVYTILLLTVGAKWWRRLNYFGDGILLAELNVSTLGIARGKSGQFLKLFGPGEGDFALRPEVLTVHQQQREQSKAYVTVNCATMQEDIPKIVTSLMNPLLRSLGHAILWNEFEDDMRVIAAGSNPHTRP
jgi:Putative DNA-binding domain